MRPRAGGVCLMTFAKVRSPKFVRESSGEAAFLDEGTSQTEVCDSSSWTE